MTDYRQAVGGAFISIGGAVLSTAAPLILPDHIRLLFWAGCALTTAGLFILAWGLTRSWNGVPATSSSKASRIRMSGGSLTNPTIEGNVVEGFDEASLISGADSARGGSIKRNRLSRKPR